MPNFLTLLQQGHSWLFVPSAVALGALHGLEPGHSKTMMAAFIVAIRGTVAQAALLGLAATVSHTAIVWVIALGGLYFGRHWNASSEPYFQIASAALIVGVALWMLWRTLRAAPSETDAHDHGHDHPHGQGHAHSFVLAPAGAHTQGGAGAHLHLHDHGERQDAHEREHAEQIRRRFARRHVSTGQIVLFGLTGGLIPCPASITVLLLCLQLKKIALGATLVLCFSIGLAITMVASGVVAALGVRHAARYFRGFGTWAHRAPYLSAALILLVGLYVGYQGWQGLA